MRSILDHELAADCERGDSRPQQRLPVLAQNRADEAEGYAEWRHVDLLIVDGQRVGVTAATRFRGSDEVKDFASIPLGYEVKAKGVRRSDGVIEATQVEAKPNGVAMFEPELIALTQRVEGFYLEHRHVPGEPTDRRLLVRGSQVDRVQRIAQRLIPHHPDSHDVNLAFATHWGFTSLSPRPCSPEENGTQERNWGYVKGNALKGRRFDLGWWRYLSLG